MCFLVSREVSQRIKIMHLQIFFAKIPLNELPPCSVSSNHFAHYDIWVVAVGLHIGLI